MYIQATDPTIFILRSLSRYIVLLSFLSSLPFLKVFIIFEQHAKKSYKKKEKKTQDKINTHFEYGPPLTFYLLALCGLLLRPPL